MVRVKCRDCGRVGNEDPKDPAPALCPTCYEKRLNSITPKLESMMEAFGPTMAAMWLEEALVDIGGETPNAAKKHVGLLLRGLTSKNLRDESW